MLAFAASDILVGGAEELQELKQVKYVESAVAGQVAGAHGALGRQLLVDRVLALERAVDIVVLGGKATQQAQQVFRVHGLVGVEVCAAWLGLRRCCARQQQRSVRGAPM